MRTGNKLPTILLTLSQGQTVTPSPCPQIPNKRKKENQPLSDEEELPVDELDLAPEPLVIGEVQWLMVNLSLHQSRHQRWRLITGYPILKAFLQSTPLAAARRMMY
jgi:hypothetical protein